MVHGKIKLATIDDEMIDEQTRIGVILAIKKKLFYEKNSITTTLTTYH